MFALTDIVVMRSCLIMLFGSLAEANCLKRENVHSLKEDIVLSCFVCMCNRERKHESTGSRQSLYHDVFRAILHLAGTTPYETPLLEWHCK